MKNTTDLLQDQLNQDKQQCEHHPYLKELTTEQYKANLKKYAYYLQHTFASNNHPQYDFLEYLNTCDCIEQDNTPLQDIEQDIKGKYKYLYNFYINNIFESYQDKINIIESQDKPQVRLYCYDVEQQKPITIFSDYFINALFGNDAYTPQQFFDRAFADAKNIFTIDAFNELKNIFLNMPNDTIEYEQLTLFDIEEEEQEEQNEILPKLEPLKHHYIKQSNEHQFFNIFMIYFDFLFSTNEMILQNQYGTKKYKIESYADIIKAYINHYEIQINEMQKEYNAIEILTISEQIKNAVEQATTEEQKENARNDILVKYPNWHNDINFLRDFKYIKEVYNKNVNNEIKPIYEDEQSRYNEILSNKPYFDMLCKELLNQDIENNIKCLKEEQTKMDNIAINGTTEFYINEKIQYLKNNMLPKSAIDMFLNREGKAERNYNVPSSNIGYFDNGYLTNKNDLIPSGTTKMLPNTTINFYGKMAPLVVGFNVMEYNGQKYEIYCNTTEKPNPFDFDVLDAVGTGIKNFNNVINDADIKPTISVADIYKYVYGSKDKIEQDKQTDIIKSLLKLNNITMLIDASSELSIEELQKGNTKVRTQRLLNFDIVINNNRGQSTISIELLQAPPLWQRAETENHIIPYNIDALNWQPSNTRDVLAMKKYLIKRIKTFENPKTQEHKAHEKECKPYRVLIDTLLNDCNIVFNTKDVKESKKRFINDKIKKWLDNAVSHRFIKSYILYTDVKPIIKKNKKGEQQKTTQGIKTKNKTIIGIEFEIL